MSMDAQGSEHGAPGHPPATASVARSRSLARAVGLLLVAGLLTAVLTAALTVLPPAGVHGQGAPAAAQEDAGSAGDGTAEGAADDGADDEVLTIMSRNLYLGADVAIALELLPDMPAAAQFMWEQVAATDLDARVGLLAAEVVDDEPAVIGLQEATRWRCRPGSIGRVATVYDFTDAFLEEARAAGVPYVIASADGQPALQDGYRIPALPFLSRVEDPATFQPRFGTDTATCGFDLADALLVREDLADRVVAAGGRAFADRYSVVPTVLTIDRGYAWADLALDGGTVRFVTTHLESLWDPGEVPHSARQAAQLLEDLEDTTTPVVVLGDINADPRDPRGPDDLNPALQPEASEACPAQTADPTPDTADPACNAYWTLRAGGFADAGPDPLDGANLTWGTSAELAGPDLARLDDALEMGNPYGFTDRLDYVLYRGAVTVEDTHIIGNRWPNSDRLWPCDAPTQRANAEAAAQRLVEAGVLDGVPEELDCLPTDHAGVVAQLRFAPTGLAAAQPPPTRWRSPIGLWGALGLLLLVLLAWRVSRAVQRRRRGGVASA